MILQIEGISDESSAFLYEVSEYRSLLRAAGKFEEADVEKGYLDECGVNIRDINKNNTIYEFQGYTWKISIK